MGETGQPTRIRATAVVVIVGTVVLLAGACAPPSGPGSTTTVNTSPTAVIVAFPAVSLGVTVTCCTVPSANVAEHTNGSPGTRTM